MPTAKRSSYEDPIREDDGIVPNAPPQSANGIQRASEHSTRYNEDDESAIFRSDHEAHAEHMVTRKEDSWLKTIMGVSGNVLEWYDFAVFGYCKFYVSTLNSLQCLYANFQNQFQIYLEKSSFRPIRMDMPQLLKALLFLEEPSL